jgi:hypothetical protein
MKIKKKIRLFAIIIAAASAGWVLLAKSKTVRDANTGLNGSFETVQSGLPVNWLFYTSKTASSGDFDIALDQSEFKDGKQSLKFTVRKCSDQGGWRSPGFCQEFKAEPGETYSISFWAKNDGSKFVAKAGGVNAFEHDYQMIAATSEQIESWRRFSTNVSIAKGMRALRWELNVLQPGTFWIDDLKIEKIANNPL